MQLIEFNVILMLHQETEINYMHLYFDKIFTKHIFSVEMIYSSYKL